MNLETDTYAVELKTFVNSLSADAKRVLTRVLLDDVEPEWMAANMSTEQQEAFFKHFVALTTAFPDGDRELWRLMPEPVRRGMAERCPEIGLAWTRHRVRFNAKGHQCAEYWFEPDGAIVVWAARTGNRTKCQTIEEARTWADKELEAAGFLLEHDGE